MQCPHCKSNKIVKDGFRQTRLENIQLYKCRTCKKQFINRYIKNAVYPLKIILAAISYYNQGYTLNQTKTLTSQQFKVKIPTSTIHNWIKKYQHIFTFARLRKKFYLYPKDTIKTRTFFHDQPYKFQYHTLKLILTKNQNLKQYIRKVFDNRLPENIKNLKRCSKHAQQIPNRDLETVTKENNTGEFAKLAIEIIENNKQRHQTIQNLMLINDSATIATELPVFNNKLLGHIDILQFRFNTFHILDYKPEITNHSLHQVLLYKQLFSECTNTPQSKIRIACFNENGCVEVFN